MENEKIDTKGGMGNGVGDGGTEAKASSSSLPPTPEISLSNINTTSRTENSTQEQTYVQETVLNNNAVVQQVKALKKPFISPEERLRKLEELKQRVNPGVPQYPPLDRLAKHQQDAIFNPARFKVLVWHRRARKTTTALYELTRQALLRKGVYWYVAPTYGIAKDAVWRDPTMMQTVIPPEIVRKTNESELVVYLKNGSIIQLKGADNPDTLRGANPMGIVLDEYATMDPGTWEVVEPILRANQGWAWFIGTPKGKNHFYKAYSHGLKGLNGWHASLLKASTSGIIESVQLQESRNTMSEDLYSQEFECEWLEGQGQVFRGVRDIADAIPTQPLENHSYIMGVDLAKAQDWTVITVYDRMNNNQVYIERFQSLDWPYQKVRIKKIFDHYNQLNMGMSCVAYVDATGIGDPICDDLALAGVAVEPFKITEVSKRELIDKLRMYINQKIIHIIPTKETLQEFDNFSYKIGFTGKISYGAVQGEHDDIVLSHALAVWSINPIYRPAIIPRRTLIQSAYDRAKLNAQNLEYDNENSAGWREWVEIE